MDWKSVRTVVVPVDLEEPQPEALKLARQAVMQGERVHVISVLPVLEASLAVQIPEGHRITTATKALDEWLVTQEASDAAVTHVRVGATGPEIVAYAQEVDADLIVMPSHRRRGISRLVLGSVAERVVRTAKRPVLVI